MRPLMVVRVDPRVKIDLQLFHRRVDLLSERDLVELVQDRLMEALADHIGLRRLGFGARMVDVVDGQIQLNSCCSTIPQYSVPRSVSTRSSCTPCDSYNGRTWSFCNSAAASGVFVVYSFAKATFAYVSTKVC